MSHVSTVESLVTDEMLIHNTCDRLKRERGLADGLMEPRLDEYQMYDGSRHTGIGFKLPGWQHPVVFDTNTGECNYDNYEGRWGDITELNQFKQHYTLQAIMENAEMHGHMVEYEMNEESGEIQGRVLVGQ